MQDSFLHRLQRLFFKKVQASDSAKVIDHEAQTESATADKARSKFRDNSGMFTLVELMLITAVIAVSTVVILVLIRPDQLIKQSRDEKRIADLETLSAAIERYIADNGVPPDLNMRLRSSTQSASTTSAASANGTGWIPVDLSKYTEMLPVDPLNQGQYVYRYYRSGNFYKLDAVMEYLTKRMQNSSDGGNDNCHFEVGNGLSQISLPGGC